MRTGNRASAVIIKDGKILLMHRKKDGHEYWIFPGGEVEKGETDEEAVIREVKEETNHTMTSCREIFADNFQVNSNGLRHNTFFVCAVDGNETKLGGEELKNLTNTDWINPEWIDMVDFTKLDVLPTEAKNKVMELYGNK